MAHVNSVLAPGSPDLGSSPGAAVPRRVAVGSGCCTSVRCQKPSAVTVKDTPQSQACLEMILFPFSSYPTPALLSKQSHFPLNLSKTIYFSKWRGAKSSTPLSSGKSPAPVPVVRNGGWGRFLPTQSCVWASRAEGVWRTHRLSLDDVVDTGRAGLRQAPAGRGAPACSSTVPPAVTLCTRAGQVSESQGEAQQEWNGLVWSES